MRSICYTACMTNEEAILINDAVIRRAKDRRGDNNYKEWFGKRCVLCTYAIEEGDDYLSWCPIDYRKWQKLEQTPSLTHIQCLDFKDRSSYPHNHKVATTERRNFPLLTNDLVYDIIQEKEIYVSNN